MNGFLHCVCVSRSVMSNSLQLHGLQHTRLLCPWDSPGKQEYWSGLPCPPPGGIPDLGIEPMSSSAPASQTDSLLFELAGKPFIYGCV